MLCATFQFTMRTRGYGKMVAVVFMDVRLTVFLATISFIVGKANNITVYRWENKLGDNFRLGNCNNNQFHIKCREMKANYLLDKYCSCRCDNPITFLLYERKCVSGDDLKNHSLFGSGVYIFNKKVDLSSDGEIQTNRDSHGCGIVEVKYLKGDVWYNYTNQADWKIDNSESGKLILKWKSTTSPDPKGRIFKIQLKHCQSDQWKNIDQKVFFKSKGNFSFKIPTSSSSVLPTQALTTSSMILDSVEASFKPLVSYTSTVHLSVPVVVSSSVCSNHETCLTSSPSLSNIIPTATPAFPGTTTPTAAFPGTTTPTPAFPGTTTPTSTPVSFPTTFNSSAGARTSRKSPTGAIVGSVLACIAVIAGVIVLIVVWKKRKQRSRSSSADRSVKVPPDSNNLLYGKNQGEVITLSRRKEQEETNAAKGDEEYDYATVDGGPDYHGNKPAQQLYQSLTQQPVQDSVYTALNQDKNASPEPSYLYNHLQRPEFKPHCPTNPTNALYSSLEKPKEQDYLEPGVHIDAVNSKKTSEPLYNTLEDPNSGQASPHDEPLYNVLEDPDSDYDNAPIGSDLNHPDSQDNAAYLPAIDSEDHCCPDCDVLEGPNSKRPQPDTKHDPVYAVLEGPDGPTSDPSYQALNIRTDEDVYQPLDRTTQPIYQPLHKAPNTRGRDSTA